MLIFFTCVTQIHERALTFGESDIANGETCLSIAQEESGKGFYRNMAHKLGHVGNSAPTSM